MAIVGFAWSSCGSPATAPFPHLEANDTIVHLGQHHVLVPRSDKCTWKLVFNTDPPESSVWFDGCEEKGPYPRVRIGAMLFEGLDRLDQDRFDEFMTAVRLFADGHECLIRPIREGRIGNKKWSLCGGPASHSGGNDEGLLYTLNVRITDERTYYFILSCEIHPAYFETFQEDGEMERIVNAVQLW